MLVGFVVVVVVIVLVLVLVFVLVFVLVLVIFRKGRNIIDKFNDLYLACII